MLDARGGQLTNDGPVSPRVLVVVLVLALLVPSWGEAQPTTTRVSVGPGGAQGNQDSHYPALSSDGRLVTFGSLASTLVNADSNGAGDVFVHDAQTVATTRVSVGSLGGGAGQIPAISADGRFVAFDSAVNDLVPGDTNGRSDVFVHDRHTGATSRVSVGPAGVQGNDASLYPSISADGRWVAFWSFASNLVAGDTNFLSDVFVHDRQTATTTRVNVGPGGVQAMAGASAYPSISGDGRWVAFHSWANNLVEGGANTNAQAYVHDRHVGVTTRVSVGPGGVQGTGDSTSAAISDDGRWVTFESRASNLVSGDTNNNMDVFVHSLDTGTTTRVNLGSAGVQAAGGTSQHPAISADGRFVTFTSTAINLVPNDTNGVGDVFVRDRQTGLTTRVSVGPGGVQGNNHSSFSAISADGRWVAFGSLASNLVAGDTNGVSDVFLSDRGDTVTPLAPWPPSGLVVHSIVGNLVTLRWTIEPGALAPTGFELEGGVNPGDRLATLATGSLAPTFTFVAPSGSFYVRMHALHGAVRSAASNEVRIHVNVPAAPSAPANLLAVVDGSTLALAWSHTYAGGAPTSLVLDVTGTIATSIPLVLGESLGFAGVPAGSYTLALRAQNTAGSSPPSNAVSVTIPGPCSGPPAMPASVYAFRNGNTVFVDWMPGASGPAPTSYVLQVTGSFAVSIPTNARSLSGAVGPGSYTLSVIAVNACGESQASTPHTVVVP